MNKRIVAVAAVLCMGGCATVPKTSSELVTNSDTKQTYCYPVPRDEVGKRIGAFLGKCYGPVEVVMPVGGTYIPMKADFQVVNEKLPNGNRYSVRNFVGFGYAANVTNGSSSCETEVQMYAITGLWKKVFAAADQAARGENVACP